MIRRWLLYLAALAGTSLFWLCYTGWYSGYLLSLVLALPWLSLALSLPAMRRARIALLLPEAAARIGFAVLGAVNGVVVWRYLLPHYQRSFAEPAA